MGCVAVVSLGGLGVTGIRSGSWRLFALVVSFAVVVEVVVGVPAAVAAPGPIAAERLAGLGSERPAATVAAAAVGGDFSRRPGVAPTAQELELDRLGRVRVGVEDWGRSPRERVWRNGDGSHTSELSLAPRWSRGDDGVWRDIDLSLVPDGGGRLRPTVPLVEVRVPGRGDGVVSTPTPAGVIEARHRDAQAQTAGVAGGVARFGDVFGDGRGLEVSATATGWEDDVVLADRNSSGRWRVDFGLPEGVVARQGGGAVEFVDAAGRPVASYGDGVAWDRAVLGFRGAQTAVSVRLP